MAQKLLHNYQHPHRSLFTSQGRLIIFVIIISLFGLNSFLPTLKADSIHVADNINEAKSEILKKAVIGDWQSVLRLIGPSTAAELAGQVPNGYYGGSVLHLAVVAGRQDVVQALVESGKVDLDSQNEFWGKPALIIAAEFGRGDIARLLLDAGASVSAVDLDGDTALHEAAYNGFLDIAKLLVDHGAEVTARDKAGNLPADDARLGRRFLIASYLDGLLKQPFATTDQQQETSIQP